MRLATEFIQLPMVFDAHRMAEEALSFAETDWDYHPNGFAGNSALVLVSAHGQRNNDYSGPMQATQVLKHCPYIQQVMASFNSVLGRSRLMRLEPGAQVTPHSDTDYNWRHRVRIHIPIITHPDIIFSSIGNIDIHMQAGEAWVFDNWKPHAVYNNSDVRRIHLVVDTTGSAEFWALVARGRDARHREDSWRNDKSEVDYRPNYIPQISFERFNAMPVRSPDEVDGMLTEFKDDLRLPEGRDTAERLRLFEAATSRFSQDWRSLWALHADTVEGLPYYETQQRILSKTSKTLLGEATLASNAASATKVLGKWLTATTNASALRPLTPAEPGNPTETPDTSLFDSPVFIIAAPRSGSTALFEILQANMELWTVGDESHTEFESIKQLHPSARGFDSNELGAEDLTLDIGRALVAAFTRKLRNAQGTPFSEIPPSRQPSRLRFLEKTPRNALRIPFLKKLFPNAMFIFLHRRAQPNIGSIIDAWLSGKFITYRRLPGWNGMPWSLLLSKGWRDLDANNLAAIATWQWSSTNAKILTDLQALPDTDWCSVSYEELIEKRETTIKRLCTFIDVPFGPKMRALSLEKLPLSRYTLTPPDADKWKRHESAIKRELSSAKQSIELLEKLR